MRAASGAVVERTTSTAVGLAISISGRFGSASAPTVAARRVTTPLSGARSVARSAVRRAVATAARALACSASACSASLRGITPASTSRVARVAAASAARSVASALFASASIVVRSSSISASPRWTRWPVATSTRAMRAATGTPSAANSPVRGTTVPMPSTDSANDCGVRTMVSAATTACVAAAPPASSRSRLQPATPLARASQMRRGRVGGRVTGRSGQRFQRGVAGHRERSTCRQDRRCIAIGLRVPSAVPPARWRASQHPHGRR